MPRIPQDLPQWLRTGDFMLVRFIALACFMRMLAHGDLL